MHSQISKVDHINVISIDESSVVEIGDSRIVTPTSKAIAVQREKAIFWDYEFAFRDYPLFLERIPQPTVQENIHTCFMNNAPIHVENIDILAVAASSVIHIGSSELLESEARIKDIRHLLKEPDKK